MYEIGQSDTGYWLTVHSGSRKFGEKICMFHQNIAKKELEHKRTVLLADQILKITKQYKGQQIADEIAKVKKELGIDYDYNISGMEYLEGQNAMNYFFDMILAQQYAKYNRAIMMRIVLNNVFKESTQLDMIESVHNYIDFNDLIIRKGAIRSYVGERSLIPLNMEDGMLIVEGKSNPEWNYSMNHGSGRLMSRSKAKEVLNLDEMKQGMSDAGVYSSSLNKGTLDEAKGAYKPTELIEQAIEPTATILERVKPILNIKDSSDQMSWKERRKQLKNK
jgi:RNA-splicing ligase RtcB